MKILVLCEQGNNRSVTIAHQLKYWSHDVLTGGIRTNSGATLAMLCAWADRIIIVDSDLSVPESFQGKLQVWPIGPDVYPRPFNRELYHKVKALMEEHKTEYKPTTGDY